MAPRSSAWPLVAFLVALVLYASLYPFRGWRLAGVEPWAFLWAPWPRHWTGFDVVSNALGYAVLGFGFAVAWLRSDGRWRTWWLAWLVPGALSLIVETMQSYLPMRVASRLDLALNVGGALVGATLAWCMAWWGGLRSWSRWRAQWLVPQAHGSLVLLALWPLALLYPTSLPLGLGQVREPLEAAGWWPSLQALAGPGAWTWTAPDLSTHRVQAVVVGLALLVPWFMGLADVRTVSRRLVFAAALLVCAVAMLGLSSALTYGPEHAWAWVTPPVMQGLAAGFVLGVGLIGVSRRWAHGLMVLCLLGMLVLLNRLPASAYLAQSLAVWEQGRFIRFYGLSQWLGWLWPWVALAYGVRACLRRAAV